MAAHLGENRKIVQVKLRDISNHCSEVTLDLTIPDNMGGAAPKTDAEHVVDAIKAKRPRLEHVFSGVYRFQVESEHFPGQYNDVEESPFKNLSKVLCVYEGVKVPSPPNFDAPKKVPTDKQQSRHGDKSNENYSPGGNL